MTETNANPFKMPLNYDFSTRGCNFSLLNKTANQKQEKTGLNITKISFYEQTRFGKRKNCEIFSDYT